MARRRRSNPGNVQLRVVQPNAAGVDVGADEIFVAVPTDRDPQPVRSFPTFTRDLWAAADWLQACGIDTVAMESTGVYWIPFFQILEERGFKVFLVNARPRQECLRAEDRCIGLPVDSVPPFRRTPERIVPAR
jgi:transposase